MFHKQSFDNPFTHPSPLGKSEIKSLTRRVLGTAGKRVAQKMLEASGRRVLLSKQLSQADFSLSGEERRNLKEMILQPGEFLLEYPTVEPELLGEERVTNVDGCCFHGLKDKYHFLDTCVPAEWNHETFEKLEMNDPSYQASLLSALNGAEGNRVGRVMRISELVSEELTDYDMEPVIGSGMDVDVLLKAIDAKGYRPATLSELVVFASRYWHPEMVDETFEADAFWNHEVNPELHEQQQKLNFDVQDISGLATFYEFIPDPRYVPKPEETPKLCYPRLSYSRYAENPEDRRAVYFPGARDFFKRDYLLLIRK